MFQQQNDENNLNKKTEISNKESLHSSNISKKQLNQTKRAQTNLVQIKRSLPSSKKINRINDQQIKAARLTV